MLWNTIETAERHKAAQLAREFDIALPIELVRKNPAAAKTVLKRWAHDMFVAEGLMVDINFHNMLSKNPHAHIMTTMRRVHPAAMEFGEESRYAFEKTKARDQNDWGYMDFWRETWADYANAAMAAHGIEARIDHRTLIEQGVTDREPNIHIGPVANAMQARGEETSRQLKHDLIWFDNETPWFEENRRYVDFMGAEEARERRLEEEQAAREEAERKEVEAAAAIVARADVFTNLKDRLDEAAVEILGDYAVRFYGLAERLKVQASASSERNGMRLQSLAGRLAKVRPDPQIARKRLAGVVARLDKGVARASNERSRRLELVTANLERVRPAFAMALAQARSRAAAAAEAVRTRASFLAASAIRSAAMSSGQWMAAVRGVAARGAVLFNGADRREGGRERVIQPERPLGETEALVPASARDNAQDQRHERELSRQRSSVLEYARSFAERLKRARSVRKERAAAKAAEAAKAFLDRNLELAGAAIRARIDYSAPGIEQSFLSDWLRTMKATDGPMKV